MKRWHSDMARRHKPAAAKNRSELICINLTIGKSITKRFNSVTGDFAPMQAQFSKIAESREGFHGGVVDVYSSNVKFFKTFYPLNVC
jgi:hypothetical protein